MSKPRLNQRNMSVIESVYRAARKGCPVADPNVGTEVVHDEKAFSLASQCAEERVAAVKGYGDGGVKASKQAKIDVEKSKSAVGCGDF